MHSLTHGPASRRLSLLCVILMGCGASTGSRSDVSAQIDAVVALPPGDIGRVDEALGKIDDPIVRQAALFEWAQRHQGRYSQDAVGRLCERLPGSSRMLCLRRLASPHLAEPPR